MEKGAGENGNAGYQVDDDDYLFDDDIQPGQETESLNESPTSTTTRPELGGIRQSNTQPDSSQGRTLLLVLTYPELHQFVLEMVHLLERVYNIQHHHRHH